MPPASAAPVESRAFRIVLAVCAIASIVPLFSARHLPMADLPEHLASMATIRHYGDPSWKAAEYFTLAGVFETPYWLYHATGALLTALLGSAERANVVMLSIVGLGYPYALRSLLIALRRDPRLALFGCALFWTTNLIVGLLNFVASVPVVFVALALVVQQAEAPTRRRWLGLAALSVATFYLHLSSFGLFLVEAALLTWMLPIPDAQRPFADLRRRLVRLPLRLLWLAPSGAIGCAVLVAGRTIAHGHGPPAVWLSRIDLVLGLRGWLFNVFRSRVDDVLGFGLIAMLVVLGVLGRRPGVSFEERWRSGCVVLVAGVATAVWFASPSSVGEAALLLDVRMAIFVALFLVMIPRIVPGRRASIAFGAVAALTLAMSINTIYEVRAFERDDVAGFDELLRAMPRGKRLVMLNLETRSSRVNAKVFNYFGSYYRARYGGVASYSFSEMSHWPVHYRPESAPPMKMTWANPCVYRNQRDGAYFDYVMIHGDRDPLSAAPGPQWEIVGASHSWRLFKKTEGATNPEGATPDPGPCG